MQLTESTEVNDHMNDEKCKLPKFMVDYIEYIKSVNLDPFTVMYNLSEFFYGCEYGDTPDDVAEFIEIGGMGMRPSSVEITENRKLFLLELVN